MFILPSKIPKRWGSSTVIINKQHEPLDQKLTNGLRSNGVHYLCLSTLIKPCVITLQDSHFHFKKRKKTLCLFSSFLIPTFCWSFHLPFCMEFDSNFKDDLPLLSSFFSDKTTELKPQLDDDNDHGEFSRMELGSSSPSSSKGLFHSLQLHNNFDNHNHNHNHHQYLHQYFPINGSDHSINNNNNNHFSIDGSLQNLLDHHMPTTQCFDPKIEPNFGNEFSKDHTFENGANYKFMHGLLGSGNNVWTNFPGNFLPQFSQLPNSHLGLGSPATSDFSIIGYDHNKKRKRIQLRKENKSPKKLPNIIKGQWTPQEDRYTN